jgi:hypothetical protein
VTAPNQDTIEACLDRIKLAWKAGTRALTPASSPKLCRISKHPDEQPHQASLQWGINHLAPA